MDKFCSSQEDDRLRFDNESGSDTSDIDTTDTEDSYPSAVEETAESNFTQEKSIVDENVILSGK